MNDSSIQSAANLRFHEALAAIYKLSCAQKLRVFIVGGAVRDHLLRGIRSEGRLHFVSDIDLMIEGDARQFAELVNAEFSGTLLRFDRFFSAKIKAPQLFSEIQEIDFASTRAETYERPGALPLVTLASLDDDLRRRDFSINAMALQLEESGIFPSADQLMDTARNSPILHDKFAGRSALLRREISVLHSASFLDDPTRLFRAIRYAERFGFALAAETEQMFYAAISTGALQTASNVRIFNEIKKMLREEQRSEEMLQRVISSSLLQFWTPVLGVPVADLSQAFAGLVQSPLFKPTVPPSVAGTEKELLLLRTLFELNPKSDPLTWGLSLSNKVIKQIRTSIF